MIGYGVLLLSGRIVLLIDRRLIVIRVCTMSVVTAFGMTGVSMRMRTRLLGTPATRPIRMTIRNRLAVLLYRLYGRFLLRYCGVK